MRWGVVEDLVAEDRAGEDGCGGNGERAEDEDRGARRGLGEALEGFLLI